MRNERHSDGARGGDPPAAAPRQPLPDGDVAELIVGVQTRQTAARAEFLNRFGGVLAAAVQRARARQQVPEPEPLVVEYARRWALLYIQSRPRLASQCSPGPAGWTELAKLLEIALLRQFFLGPSLPAADIESGAAPPGRPPSSAGPPAKSPPAPLGCGPWTAAGNVAWAAAQWPRYQVAGDAYEASWDGAGLAFCLMDGMGKSWLPRLMARGVTALWRQLTSEGLTSPTELLRALQRELAEVVPEGFFLEGVVGWLREPDRLELASAGGGNVLLADGEAGEGSADSPRSPRQPPGGRQLRHLALGGPLLGDLDYGQDVVPELHCERLPPAAELVMATDGLVDQFGTAQRLIDQLTRQRRWPVDSLHAALCECVQAALEVEPQLDDITWIAVQTPPCSTPPERAVTANVPDRTSPGGSNCRHCAPFDCERAVAASLAGDQAARDALVQHLLPALRRKVDRVSGRGREADSEDALQNAVLLLLTKLQSWRAEAPFCKWAQVVACRAAISLVRQRGRLLAVEQPEQFADSRDSRRSDEVQDCLKTRFADLDPKWQTVFRLAAEGELTRDQIAQRVGCSRKSVYLWLTQMRELLSDCLQE